MTEFVLAYETKDYSSFPLCSWSPPTDPWPGQLAWMDIYDAFLSYLSALHNCSNNAETPADMLLALRLHALANGRIEGFPT